MSSLTALSPIPVHGNAAQEAALSLHLEGVLGRSASDIPAAGAPARAWWPLAALVGAFALCLLALVDVRRGFLLPEYPVRTPYLLLSPYHGLMLATGVLAVAWCLAMLRRHEARAKAVRWDGPVRALAFTLLGLLVADLFLYRGVAAARAAQAGTVSLGWMDAFGATGWLRPLALAATYTLNVWHATLLGVFLAGLALTVLPRYLKPLFSRSGLGGSLFGSLFALPQPFCSCCAAVIAPSYVRQGASNSFSLAFVVGAPMLNITGLVLSVALLPAPYAATRIAAGLLLTIPVTFAVAWLAERWGARDTGQAPGWVERWITRWVDYYCRIFHLEEMVRERPLDTPSAFFSTWMQVSLRVGVLLVPTLFGLAVITAAVVQLLPSAFGNNVPSVVLAAVVGTLLMISTWSEIPIAQQMLAAGFSGPAAALLVALPPVSLPCLMLLGGATGNFRITAFMGLAVMAVSIVAGLAFL
ncbi:MAG: permease [Chloroflexi bacterium]|nr:permease [Chloroflexota bacterium]